MTMTPMTSPVAQRKEKKRKTTKTKQSRTVNGDQSSSIDRSESQRPTQITPVTIAGATSVNSDRLIGMMITAMFSME